MWYIRPENGSFHNIKGNTVDPGNSKFGFVTNFVY